MPIPNPAKITPPTPYSKKLVAMGEDITFVPIFILASWYSYVKNAVTPKPITEKTIPIILTVVDIIGLNPYYVLSQIHEHDRYSFLALIQRIRNDQSKRQNIRTGII